VQGRKGDYTTQVVQNQACVFAFFEGEIAKCAFEKAYQNNELYGVSQYRATYSYSYWSGHPRAIAVLKASPNVSRHLNVERTKVSGCQSF